MKRWMMLAMLPALNGGSAFCQQLAFTSRTYVQSPVIITSVQPSKEFGFESVVLRNDGPGAISAVRFQITFRTTAGDEIADERREAVSLEPRDSKRLPIFMAKIEALRQTAKVRKQPSALAILTIESVEFQDGTEWKQTERDSRVPIDPLQPQRLIPRK